MMELEKLVPKVGAALLTVFFPSGVKYEPARLYSNRKRKFWKSAFWEMKKRVPRRVEQVPVSHPESAADIGYGLCSKVAERIGLMKGSPPTILGTRLCWALDYGHRRSILLRSGELRGIGLSFEPIPN